MNHAVMNLEVILMLLSELSLDHFFFFSLTQSQSCKNQAKNLSFGLSLNK